MFQLLEEDFDIIILVVNSRWNEVSLIEALVRPAFISPSDRETHISPETGLFDPLLEQLPLPAIKGSELLLVHGVLQLVQVSLIQGVVLVNIVISDPLVPWPLDDCIVLFGFLLDNHRAVPFLLVEVIAVRLFVVHLHRDVGSGLEASHVVHSTQGDELGLGYLCRVEVNFAEVGNDLHLLSEDDTELRLVESRVDLGISCDDSRVLLGYVLKVQLSLVSLVQVLLLS